MISFWLGSAQTIRGPIQDLPDAAIVTVSEDGRFIATGNPDGTVRLWNYADGQRLAEFKEQDRFEYLPNPLAFSSDSTLLASGDNLGRVFLYDVRRRRVLLLILEEKSDAPPRCQDPTYAREAIAKFPAASTLPRRSQL